MPIDDGLIGGIHVERLARAEAAGDVPHDQEAFQASTLDALLRGELIGDLTIGELLQHGDLGLGTLNLLDGELIVVDGEALVARTDGSVERVPHDTQTPFAVVCPFSAEHEGPLGAAEGFAAVTAAVDALAPPDATCVAVRIDARIAHARLRSVPKQTQPSPTLADAVAAQVEFELGEADATIVGFRFPRDVAGLELPGWHLHLVTADRKAGGHVLDLSVLDGQIAIERETELTVEVPTGVDVGRAGVNAQRDRELDEMERG
ncbi:MAG: acetolactate decarboxylase [Gaiellales bacterium]